MDFIVEFIKEVIFVFVFQYPGALVRWIFIKRKKSFKQLIIDDPYLNSFFTVLLIGVGFIVYILIK